MKIPSDEDVLNLLKRLDDEIAAFYPLPSEEKILAENLSKPGTGLNRDSREDIVQLIQWFAGNAES